MIEGAHTHVRSRLGGARDRHVRMRPLLKSQARDHLVLRRSSYCELLE